MNQNEQNDEDNRPESQAYSDEQSQMFQSFSNKRSDKISNQKVVQAQKSNEQQTQKKMEESKQLEDKKDSQKEQQQDQKGEEKPETVPKQFENNDSHKKAEEGSDSIKNAEEGDEYNQKAEEGDESNKKAEEGDESNQKVEEPKQTKKNANNQFDQKSIEEENQQKLQIDHKSEPKEKAKQIQDDKKSSHAKPEQSEEVKDEQSGKLGVEANYNSSSQTKQRELSENQSDEKSKPNDKSEVQQQVDNKDSNQNQQQSHTDSQNQGPKEYAKYIEAKEQVSQNEENQQQQAQIRTAVEKQSQANTDQRKTKTPEDTQRRKTNLEQLEEKYKEYLEIIFEHYCKITYATGNDPTFSSIQHKASVMTINKFMIFCKDFEIGQVVSAKGKDGKVKESNSRTALIEMFKKNAEFYKEMSFEQFLDVLQKIAITAFSKLRQLQKSGDIQQTENLTFQMIKMLQYMEISYSKQFKETMKKLNINYVLKTNRQLNEKKVPLLGYRFKTEKRKVQDPKQQMNNQIHKRPSVNSKQRKIQENTENENENGNRLNVISNNRIPPSSKSVGRKHNDLSYRISGAKSVASSKNLSYNNNSDRNRKPLDKAFDSKKSLGPLIPPPKRKISTVQSSNAISSPNIPPGLTGYAKIHLAKKGILLPEQGRGNVGLRVNGVVEAARMEVQQLQNVQSGRSNRALTSKNSNAFYGQQSPVDVAYPTSLGYSIEGAQRVFGSNDEDFLAASQDSNSRSNSQIRKQDQLLREISRSKSQVPEDLTALVDANDSDEDEYLQKHFQKEQNSGFSKKLDSKIGML